VKLRARVWNKPDVGKKGIADTAGGKFLIDGTTGVWRGIWSRSEEIRKVLRRELRRLGWDTTKIKVTELRSPDLPEAKQGEFFVNIGYLRGLEPNALYQILRAQPSYCGRKKILSVIAKLPERVEALRGSGLLDDQMEAAA
jgi:hypothetical protein